jgi:hypothetical protein
LSLGCTVEELLNRVSSAELTEWMAYARLEPFGPHREDLRAGVIASVMATAPQGQPHPQPNTFFPEIDY